MTDLSENTSDLSENLSENAPFDEVTEVSNTDTQEQSSVETVSESDAEIDAINEALAEAEDLENTCETLGENLEPVENTDRLPDEQVGNSEQLEPDFEIPEPEAEPYVCPWADAPENTLYYEKIYEDGHLGSFTESPEMAYKFGWYENRISKDDVQQSDVNGWTYRKEDCPMKSEHDLQVEVWNREILELKEELQRTDYKAIKYAEGVLTDEDYQQTGIQRQAWRKRINELERLIAG